MSNNCKALLLSFPVTAQSVLLVKDRLDFSSSEYLLGMESL